MAVALELSSHIWRIPRCRFRENRAAPPSHWGIVRMSCRRDSTASNSPRHGPSTAGASPSSSRSRSDTGRGGSEKGCSLFESKTNQKPISRRGGRQLATTGFFPSGVVFLGLFIYFLYSDKSLFDSTGRPSLDVRSFYNSCSIF